MKEKSKYQESLDKIMRTGGTDILIPELWLVAFFGLHFGRKRPAERVHLEHFKAETELKPI